jgi:hypothetical protein
VVVVVVAVVVVVTHKNISTLHIPRRVVATATTASTNDDTGTATYFFIY